MINPPIAGPAANPKLIANRTKVRARVLFSGLAYTPIETNIAGRNISAITNNKNIPIQSPSNEVMN